MRGVETRIQEIRHKIFTEVARMAYHTEWPVKERMEALPYTIIPGEKGNFRNDVFLERAIVGERLRLAMGLPYRSAAEHSPISDGIEAADKDETYYTPPLINVIKFACNACPEKRVHVTDGCQGCLAHPCMEVCPKDAISLDRTTGKSIIDQEKCIKCGRCASVCSYNAIIVQERHVQRPVAWMPFLLTKTAKQISIMTSVFRADNALSTVLLVRLLINPRFSRLSELYSPVKRSMLQLLLHLLDSLVQKLLPESYVQP